MRTPACLNLLPAECCMRTIISACSRSLPAGAPSSQSQVTSKMGPNSACNSSALPMRTSLPAKCSQDGMIGNGFSPWNSAVFGCTALAARVVIGSSVQNTLARHQYGVIEIEHDVRVIRGFAVALDFRRIEFAGCEVLDADQAQAQRAEVVAPRQFPAFEHM